MEGELLDSRLRGNDNLRKSCTGPIRHTALTEAAMSKRWQLDPAEQELFRQQIGPVKRLQHDQVELPRTAPSPIPASTRADERQVLQDMVSDYFEPAEMETGEELQYCREGLQHAVLRKLRRGYFRVSAVLDLHGLTAAAAHQVLALFLHEARRDDPDLRADYSWQG